MFLSAALNASYGSVFNQIAVALSATARLTSFA